MADAPGSSQTAAATGWQGDRAAPGQPQPRLAPASDDARAFCETALVFNTGISELFDALAAGDESRLRADLTTGISRVEAVRKLAPDQVQGPLTTITRGMRKADGVLSRIGYRLADPRAGSLVDAFDDAFMAATDAYILVYQQVCESG